MSTAIRLGLVAFCCDFALYVIMSALPFRLIEFGAGPLILGLAPAFYSAPYSALALYFGGRSDLSARAPKIRWGVTIAAAGALALWRGNSAWTLIGCIPILGWGLALVWPSVQAAFSEIDDGRRLSRQVGIYNLSWSAGKGAGFLVGGSLVVALGPSRSFLAAAVAYLIAALSVPALRPAGHHKIEAHTGRPELSARERSSFLRSAWLINGVAFGVGAVFNHHLPKILLARGEDALRFGQLLGTIFLAQTLSFPLLARWTSWHYRLRELVLVQLLLTSLALGFVALPPGAWLFAGAAVLGASLGFSYQSSLYYSLHAPTGRGRQAGVHEATLGAISALLPFAGGVLAQTSGDLRAPFALASLAVVAAVAFAIRQVNGARRS